MQKLLLLFILLIHLTAYSQNKLFRVFTDSAALVESANQIVADFSGKVNAIDSVFTAKPTAILNTQPFLIFYSPKYNQVNLPIWSQVEMKQKQFFYQLGGNEKKGKQIFGYFFNGFYLAHELGHALQKATNKRDTSLYQNEYFANIVAILYWRKTNRTMELHQCYKYAKQMVSQLPNPVPPGEDPVKYFNTHYSELGADPYKYGYYQFAQFVKIYEDKTLENFDVFVMGYLAK
jgi:hypothetical protein